MGICRESNNSLAKHPTGKKASLQKDIELFVKRLQSENLLEKEPGRCFKSFASIDFEPLKNLKGD